MLLVYYNPTKQHFYLKIVSWLTDHKVGDVDQYGHIIVRMYYLEDGLLIQCKSRYDYFDNKRIKRQDSIRYGLIDRAIGLLDKLKK